MNKTVVMKFGGASVASTEHFSRIADIIIHRKKNYDRVIVVVSAMGDTTNDLIALARSVNPNPPQREYDMLVTVGERISISLLAMALEAKGSAAISFTGSQAGIITSDRHTDARIVDVRPRRLVEQLASDRIVIVAGFQGCSTTGEITTLGRGGSDTTAVALAVALKAEKVEFFKDVSGVYNNDPKIAPDAERIAYLSYEEALRLLRSGAKVLSLRCVELAAKNCIPLYVSSFLADDGEGTLISDYASSQLENPIYELEPVTCEV
ncbi:MAG: aspartate kinase [Chlamydiales bacterium]|nr:aspartate kinase [Chlamydiia bacterium]MCP5507248.1 aspartate kinase [Chlamydiales bacterium]